MFCQISPEFGLAMQKYEKNWLLLVKNINIIRVMSENQAPVPDPVLFAKALADDTRQVILRHLCCVWLSVNDIVAKLEGRVNQPTVSHHLKLLQEANLVLVRQEGRQRFYSLNEDFFTVCCNTLMRNFAPSQPANLIAPEAIG
jgi:ArsR family transcriptional regulator, arsenate/arsenite/antimonite-responsive transcriptional repressor